MTSIAAHYGFYWDTLWQLDENAELRERRGDPRALAPDDELHIPELRCTQVSRAVDARHRFKRKGTPARFEVRLLEENTPRADLPYTLIVEGVQRTGVTDAEGWIREWISPLARRGQLIINDPKVPEPGEERYELELGHLDPIDTVSGVQGRLHNLGWYSGPIDGEPSDELAEALLAFQRQYGLPLSADLDEPTLAKLEDVHGR